MAAILASVRLIESDVYFDLVDQVPHGVDGVGLEDADPRVPSALGATIGSSVPSGRSGCPPQNAFGSDTE
jgi:hypothetical protein